jgi:hypothetical protein
MKRVDAVVEDLVKDVARIYNYYLHGTDDDVSVCAVQSLFSARRIYFPPFPLPLFLI